MELASVFFFDPNWVHVGSTWWWMLEQGKGTPIILTLTKDWPGSARILSSGNDSCLLGGLRSWLIFGFINEHFGLELNFMTFALLASELVWLHKHLLVGKALADLMLEVDGNGDGFIDFKAGWILRVHTFVDGCTLACPRWCKLSLLKSCPKRTSRTSHFFQSLIPGVLGDDERTGWWQACWELKQLTTVYRYRTRLGQNDH